MAETLTRLKAAGLHSVPGGGAESWWTACATSSPYKDSAGEWLEVHAVAHQVGLRSSATMMYGSVDTFEDRVDHLLKLRDLQDESLAHSPRPSPPLSPGTTSPTGRILGGTRASGFDYLRTIAISRVMLDNFPHLQASWVTQGPRSGRPACDPGVDDFGSTMMEENVVSAAGCVFTVPIEEIERLIRDAGYEPRRQPRAMRHGGLTASPPARRAPRRGRSGPRDLLRRIFLDQGLRDGPGGGRFPLAKAAGVAPPSCCF